MSLATLSIDIEARLAGLAAGLDKAGRLAEKESARMAKAFSLAGSALAGLGAGVGLAGLTALFDKVVNGLDALNDLADATGASVENLSALEDVALRTGTSLDTVGSSLVKFNQVLGNAKAGSDAAEALKALGLNAEELKRIDPAEALRQTAAALAGFADDGNKARIIQELFGKSVKEAAPFLKDLAEQGALVGKVTKEQAEEAEKFNKQLYALQASAVEASRAIAGPLVSSMNALIDKMKEAQKEGRLAAVAAEEFGRRIIKALPPQLQALALGVQIAGRGPTGAEPGAPGPAGFRPSQNCGDAFRPSLPSSVGGGGGRAGGGRASKPDIGYGIRDPFEDTKQRFLQAEKDYEQTDELLRRIEERAKDAAKALRDSLMSDGKAVFEATRTPAEVLAGEIEHLNKLLAEGAINWDTYARAQFAAQDKFDAATKETKEQAAKTNDIARDLGLTFSSAFEDAIVGGNNLRDVLKGLEQDILRIITRKLITEPLGNAISGAISGSSLSGLFGSIVGAMFGSSAGAGINGGAMLPNILRGGAATGSNYIERDMLTILHKGEAVIPKAYNHAGGGGMVINVQAVPGMSRATAMQQGEAIGRAARIALARNG